MEFETRIWESIQKFLKSVNLLRWSLKLIRLSKIHEIPVYSCKFTPMEFETTDKENIENPEMNV